jgi:hypothetical protein
VKSEEMSQPPFVDPTSHELDLDQRELDLDQIWREAVPLIRLIVLFGLLSVIPFLLSLLVGGGGGLGFLFVLLAQFVLAVGTGIVLMYVIARAIQLAGK